MLTIHSKEAYQTCDGVTRRGFLKIGALGAAGLTLADLLALEARAGIQTSHKAIINIDMRGGPPHQDIFDLKPDAPKEFRGEFKPIQTNVPGMQICELLPQLAKFADKFAVIRSLIGSEGGHGGNQVQIAFNPKRNPFQNVGGAPSIGAVVSKLQGSGPNGAPAWVGFGNTPYGYLGPTHKGFTPSSKGGNLVLHRALTAERLQDRTKLLGTIDKLRREVDRSGQMEAYDAYTQRAYEMVVSGKVADALDIKKVDPRVVARYGKKNENLLRARRLVEAGVRVVTLNNSWGGWDTHGQNFDKLRKQLPLMDQGLSALLEDLSMSGLDKDVTVVCWGEFGRTPKINKKAGRDHWPRLSHAFLAGGDMKLGQMVGKSDDKAGYAVERPIHYREVFSTLYHNLGINTNDVTILDPSGRPQYLIDSEYRQPIAELV